MIDKTLKDTIKMYTNKLVDTCLTARSSSAEIDELQETMCNSFLTVIDEILADDTLLNTLIQHSSSMKGVSMQFDEIVNWWQSLDIKTGTDLEAALDNFKIIFACNSNGIEGNHLNYHTTREVFEGNQLSNFSGTAREIFETQNQKFAFNYFVQAFEDELDIDMNMILKLHSIMMYGCYDEVRWKKGERPGKFKKGDYCVGVNDVGSFPDEVEQHIQELLDEMNDNELEGDVLIKAAYLHVMFETIHPFADGNGRVGRTLLNYYLIRHNYPPVVIFNEDKETYYLALEVFNRTGKISGFVKFLQEQMVKTWESKIRNKQSAGSSEIRKLTAFL